MSTEASDSQLTAMSQESSGLGWEGRSNRKVSHRGIPLHGEIEKMGSPMPFTCLTSPEGPGHAGYVQGDGIV